MHTVFTIATRGPGLTEITGQVREWLQRGPGGDGVLTLMIRHTSASLLIQENADPDVQVDLIEFLRRQVPMGDDPAMRWLTHTIEGPDDMPAHIKAMLLPTTLSIPVVEGRPMLGTWQGVYVVEHRTQPHRRNVVAMLR
ncbi:YjbQ family protein [Rhodobacteraceae bacterium 2376]|uniref:YjbQ family protein n=1 Tax=Rhabdonatronobacter sediminivivens TaxID=2743469 RepID=A0A7Z0I040_9RHOB|nr:secondary thiamine-phosphate synthase enzyme YjbQ [Rhabdonatronobacter sediminivivens]NYS25172.1 YjbQ family protein [Rhabdonatronobacter sediminivivens]